MNVDSISSTGTHRLMPRLVSLVAAAALAPALTACLEPVDGGESSTRAPQLAASAQAADPSLAAIAAYAEERAAELGEAPAPALRGVFSPRYRLVELDSVDADQALLRADDSTGTPPFLQGLWWMDGNPLPDKVISFARSPWDAATRTTHIDVYDEGIWSWHASLDGRALYEWVRTFELVYELTYDETLSFVTIIPTVKVAGHRVAVPESVVKFTAERVDDDLWLRRSYLNGRLEHTYSLRRIVRADGERLPTYDDYVAAAPARSVVAERVDR